MRRFGCSQHTAHGPVFSVRRSSCPRLRLHLHLLRRLLKHDIWSSKRRLFIKFTYNIYTPHPAKNLQPNFMGKIYKFRFVEKPDEKCAAAKTQIPFSLECFIWLVVIQTTQHALRTTHISQTFPRPLILIIIFCSPPSPENWQDFRIQRRNPDSQMESR